jgi:RNA polymerase sigma-70 factor (ECF subfamily)
MARQISLNPAAGGLASCAVATMPAPGAKARVTEAAPAVSPSIDGAEAQRGSADGSSFDMVACVERVRQRDEEAARLLLNQLYPLVIKLVRAHLPRRTSEEDLAQLAFMKIFAKIEQFSGLVPFEHWVSRITVNTCLNQIQAEKIRPELRWADLSEEEERLLACLPATAGDFRHPDELAASKDLVEKLLGKLSPPDRLVINLLTLEGHSVKEVAKMTGWNCSVIKVRAFRARHKLKKHLLKLMEEERRWTR